MNLPLLPWLCPPYRVAFSTRVGGVSQGPYSSLNLGSRVGDLPHAVAENRARLAKAFGYVPAKVKGLPIPSGDLLVSRQVGEGLLLTLADCLPIAIVRLDGPSALAVVHAGWQGLLSDVVSAAASALGPGRKMAVIGPSIGPCCYSIKEDVAGPYRTRFGRSVVRSGHLNLRAAAVQALAEIGCVSVEHFDICTRCHPEMFFSHRRDGVPCGRQGIIGVIE